MESDAQAEHFDRLFRSTLRRVTAYCLRRTSETSAHDAVSEVYAIAWRKRRRLPGDEHEAALWLLGVARNVLANQARGQRRWARLLRRAAEQPAPEQLPAAHADHGDDGDHDLTEAMARLSDTDRELLRLAYWDDLSHGDIAHLLGISPGAVSTRLYRARERLRARLAPDESDAHETKDLKHAHR
ncbi:sigma-70 family RNA polymerase sigma factor [Streptomyces sp. B6B3]|uniref:RNA polymerase sigma factor n=1 Tax=Streptomyces sp. B6B3 TaxID=3153570 RepID=UPI00325E9868